jgi:hypothetical protein
MKGIYEMWNLPPTTISPADLELRQKKNLSLLMDSVAYPDPYVLGLLNPDPLVQGTDSDPDPFIIKQK